MTMSDLPDDRFAKEALLSPSEQDTDHPPTRNRILNQLLHLVPTVLLTLIAGILIGSHLPELHGENGVDLPSPPGTIHQVWQHNLTFSQKPTPESERAWGSIIPVGRGFIHDEKLAQFISNIAVYHQLHCLHAVLVAYYSALEYQSGDNESTVPPPDYDEETGTRTAMPHVRHCFDYLRRGIMCSADTNLEVLDHETHLTNGWGQTKICRDYDYISEFAEKHANSSDTGIIAIM